MKLIHLIALTSASLLIASSAEETQKHTEAEKAQALVKHQEGSEKVSIDQDKQAANAQELLAEQTNTKVIELLNEVETLMAKATDRLEDANTNGDTIAMQTEIIEKIYEAAKEKAGEPGEPGSSPGMGAMLDMMGQMMGNKPGEKPGKKPGKSDQGGEGAKGASDSANTDNKGKANTDPAGERRVPRAAGKSGTKLPPEFQRALDGYNKKTSTK